MRILLLAALAGLAAIFPANGGSRHPLVVAAYNVENYLPADRVVDGKRVEGAPKPEESIRALIEVIQSVSPHVLGLSEMGDAGMVSDLQSRLKAAGLDYPHVERVQGADEERHLVLLSMFPIVARNSKGDVPFELGGKPYRIGRGILDATIEVSPEYTLRVVSAHLKSRREMPDFDQSQFRAKEAWHLRQHINGILEADPAANLILMGDFNDTKNEYPVRELIGTRGSPNYMMDLWLADSRSERWTHYWKSADIYSRIDFILVSPGLEPEINFKKSGIADPSMWNLASDHRLVYASIHPANK